MIIKTIEVNNKDENFCYKFDQINAYIHSTDNSVGKTSLIRFIVYGLGYNIPISRGIIPKKYRVYLEICVREKEYELIRCDQRILVRNGEENKYFSLKNGNAEVLSYIFESENALLMKNLLGCFYIDQDRGWILFNKGKVISGLDFSIDDLINAFAGVDNSLIVKQKTITKELSNNRNILKLYETQHSLEDYMSDAQPLTETIKNKQHQLFCLKEELRPHIKKHSILCSKKEHNDILWKDIESYGLSIKIEGKRYKLTRDNVEGLTDVDDFLSAKIADEKVSISEIKNKIKELSSEIDSLVSERCIVSESKYLGSKPSFSINKDAVENNIKIFEIQLKQIQDLIDSTTSSKKYVEQMDQLLNVYLKKLNVSDHVGSISIKNRNFSDLTGAIMQRIVLAYRAVFLKIVSDFLGVDLPFIVDMNMEIDSTTLKIIINFLKNISENHQIIVASISDLKIDFKKYELSNRLFKKNLSNNHKIDEFFT